ncbi:DUF2750 domain-containing protein [Bacillus smithii]
MTENQKNLLNCAIQEWQKYTPKVIELDEFINNWLSCIKKDGYKPLICVDKWVFPVLGETGRMTFSQLQMKRRLHNSLAFSTR